MDVITAMETTGNTVEKLGKNERTVYIASFLFVLVFLLTVIRMSNSSQKEARDAYLASIERQSDKMAQSLDKNTDALKDNTAVMIEFKTRLYK